MAEAKGYLLARVWIARAVGCAELVWADGVQGSCGLWAAVWLRVSTHGYRGTRPDAR